MSARDVIAEVLCGKYLSPSEGTYDTAGDILRALAAHFDAMPYDPMDLWSPSKVTASTLRAELKP